MVHAAPIRTQIVDFARLGPQAQEQLLEHMLLLDREVFEGATPKDLLPYLRDPRAIQVPVVLYKRGDRLVGQNIIPVLRLNVQGRDIAVFGSIAGLKPEARRSGRTMWTAVQVALAFKLRHPRMPMYFATPMMHPRVYGQFARATTNIYPRTGAPTPAAVRQIMASIANADTSMHARSHDVFVQAGLPVPVASPNEAKRLAATMGEHERFFVNYVPDYHHGNGLLCVSDLRLRTLWQAAKHSLRGRRTSA